MKASWKSHVVSENDDTIKTIRNIYLWCSTINSEFIKTARLKSLCHWKELASYYNLFDSKTGETEHSAAWYYLHLTRWPKVIVT